MQGHKVKSINCTVTNCSLQLEFRNIYNLETLRNLKLGFGIVDIKMPGLNGLEVLSEIRKENKDLLFIILTFHAKGYYRQKALEAGADYFFSKVDDFEKIAEVTKMLTNEKNKSKK